MLILSSNHFLNIFVFRTRFKFSGRPSVRNTRQIRTEGQYGCQRQFQFSNTWMNSKSIMMFEKEGATVVMKIIDCLFIALRVLCRKLCLGCSGKVHFEWKFVLISGFQDFGD